MTQFLKNIAMTGGALAFLAVSGVDWPYALGIGFF
jgi:putative oxidoreductase